MKFSGCWISNQEFAGRKSIHVFHRQLEKVRLPEEKLCNQHILFRRSWELGGFTSATMRITADDYYKLYVNGRFVTQGPAAGYPWHYYYNTVDLTPYLHKGRNLIAVHTYYQGLINRVWVSGDGRHGLLFDLECDGQIVCKSDESVLCHLHTGFRPLGTAGYETQFLEQYDSRAPEVGFEQAEFDDSGWKGACRHETMDLALFKQPTRQLEFEEIAPIRFIRLKDSLLFDFGSVYAGELKAQAIGEPGSKICLRYGQELTEDAQVRYLLRANCRYEEEWILSGEEDVLAAFDYKSFRYVQIFAPPHCKIFTDAVRMRVRHYPFDLKARCESEDPRLRAVWKLCVHSLKYGAQEGLMDCLEREKGQYLGDGCFSTAAHAVLTKDTALMEKLIDDALQSAEITPGLVTCLSCSFMQEIADYSLMLPMLMRVHQHLTGDVEFLRSRYLLLEEMVLFFRDHYSDENGMLGGLDKWCVVEWPPEARDGYDFDLTEGKVVPGTHNAVNAYYIGAVKSMEALAASLGRTFPIQSASLQQQYIRIFWDRRRKLFRDRPDSDHCSLPSNALALLYDLCPDTEKIVDMISQKRLASSMFFISFAILMGLCRIGRKDLCLELIADEQAWLRMLREGATTTWEGWGKDSKWNTSLFHLAFTYPVLFLTDWGMEKLF